MPSAFSPLACVARRGRLLGALLAVALVFGDMPLAFAQAVPSGAAPGRERESFIDRPPPRAQPGGPTVVLPSTVAPKDAKTVKLVIRKVEIRGSTVYTADQLAPLHQDLVGQTVTLQAVYDLAQRVTSKYGEDGYVLSRGIVPEQELNPKGAVVRIDVVEGYIDQVEWSPGPVSLPGFFTGYAAKITAERPVNIRTLERYLLLAGDLPGLKFSTTLKPSKTKKGASTLVVTVTEKPVDVFGRLDNRGTKARGPIQFLTSATINNLMGRHEAITLAYAGASPMKELQFVSPSYRKVLNSEGLTAFVNGTYSWGKPGTRALEILNFQTRSTIVDGGYYFPIVRSRERNLQVTGLAFMSDSYSFIFPTGDTLQHNVDRLRGARVKLDGDFADKLNGINQFNLTVSKGMVGAGSTENGNPLASRTVGRVDFGKAEAYVSRLQPLFGPISAQVAAYGQYAFTPLLTPEQCGFGVRAWVRSLGIDRGSLLGGERRAAARPERASSEGTAVPAGVDRTVLCLHRQGEGLYTQPCCGDSSQRHRSFSRRRGPVEMAELCQCRFFGCQSH